MIRAIYFALNFVMIFLGVVLAIYFDLYIGLSVIALFTFKFKKFSILSFIISMTSLTLVLLTGERGNFLIRFFSGILAFFSWKKNKFNFIKSLIFFLGIMLLIIATFLSNKNNYNK